MRLFFVSSPRARTMLLVLVLLACCGGRTDSTNVECPQGDVCAPACAPGYTCIPDSGGAGVGLRDAGAPRIGSSDASADAARGNEGGAGAGSTCPDCPAGCCDGTRCVDLQTDPNSCGSCGHGCLGGTCAGGFCQPFVIAPVPSTAFALTVDANNVYYATYAGGTLYSCPKTGCTTPTPLTTGLNDPNAILYDAASNDIFIADTDNNAVEAYTTLGALVFRDVAPSSHPTALGSDLTYMYWAIPGGIVRSTRDGQTQAQIATSVPAQISSLAVDPTRATIYGGVLGDTGSILSASTSSTGTWTYFAGTQTVRQPNTTQIVTQGSSVYWITQGSFASNYTDGGVYSCPATGCSSPTAVAGTTPLTQGTCIFTDSTCVHYVSNGGFYRCPLGGCSGGPKLVASNVYPSGGASCAQDATSFYLLETTGSLLRLAK